MKRTGMKNLILPVSLAVCLAANGAAKVNGTDTLAIGNLAGIDGSANRTVVIGSGAGAYMSGGDSNLFVGAAAGLRARNVTSSVGLGHYAMRGATNLSRCVGIGDLAFAGANNLDGATWINGQFFAGGGRFYVRPTTGGSETNATIYYADGTLYLNAARIVTPGGGVISGGTGGAGAETFDFYVSAGGDDTNDGRTPAGAKRTIDAAWNAAADGDRIAVLPGQYESPSGMSVDLANDSIYSVVVTNKSVDIIATGGADCTSMDAGGRSFIGNMERLPTIRGFTIAGIGSTVFNKGSRTGGACVVFECCRMAWTNAFEAQHSNVGMGWCVFSNCNVFAAFSHPSFLGGQGYDNTFSGCDFTDCRVEMAPVDGKPYKFGQGCSVENCIVRLDGAREVGFWMNQSLGPLGRTTTWQDTTLLATNCTYSTNGAPLVTWRNCLVAAVPSEIGNWNTNKLDRTLVVDYAQALPLGPDGRPSSERPTWRYYGYGSRAGRERRDALVEYLIEAGYITGR